MRLNCPGCGAQYEVEDTAIPDEGREVQCSSCGQGWFQYRPVTGDASRFGAPQPFVPPVAPVERAAPRPPALNDIRAFLRQEAEEEALRRRNEGAPPPPPPPEPQPAKPVPRAADIAASSLRPVPVQRSARGFGLGFFTTLTVFLLFAGVYVSAPRLANALPEFRDAIAAYVAWVDTGRLWLHGFADQIKAALS